MDDTASTVIEDCGLTAEAIRRGQGWIRLADAVNDRFTLVIATLGRECQSNHRNTTVSVHYRGP